MFGKMFKSLSLVTAVINKAIASTIAWDGTPPGGTKTEIYSWQKTGKMVQLDIRLEYQNAGSSNTSVIIDLPADCPLPLDIGGVSDNEPITLGEGRGYTALSNNGVVASAGIYKRSASASGYAVIIKGMTSSALLAAIGSFRYSTA